MRWPSSWPPRPAATRVRASRDARDLSLPAEPDLEALARLARGTALLEHDDRAGARAEVEAALELGRRHGFDYLTMQCLMLLGVVAAPG